IPVAMRAIASTRVQVIGSRSSRNPTIRTSAVDVPPMMIEEVIRNPRSYASSPKISIPAAAIPATTRSHPASARKTIWCPCALIDSITTELTRKATPVITIAPSAALTLVDPSFRQIVHVAAAAPPSSANKIADPIILASPSETSPDEPWPAVQQKSAERHRDDHAGEPDRARSDREAEARRRKTCRRDVTVCSGRESAGTP